MDEPQLRIEDVLEAFAEPAAILAEGRRIVAANSRFRERFAGGDEPIGRRCHRLLHGSPVPCEKRGETCPLVQCLEAGAPGRAFHRHHCDDGGEPVELTVCEVTRGAGGAAFFLHLTRPLPDGWLPLELEALLRSAG